ncbi:MAG: hypothetical protein FJ126_07625 [Deltaproteobacteria bacterium]|nr:hypothetical protein [Deltaproteobacteria bacterium]
MRIMRLFSLLLSLILLAATATQILAQTDRRKGPLGGAAPIKKGEVETPLHITAARLEADQNAGFVQFSGNVRAQYGESALYADSLWVYFQAEPKPASPPPGAAREGSCQGRRGLPPDGPGGRENRPHRGPGPGALRSGRPGGHQPGSHLL